VRSAATTQRLAERTARLARFDEDAVAFFAAWHDRGYDPTRTFQQEGQRAGGRWNEIAADCVSLAEAHFDVEFSRMTVVDEEHGTLGPIGRRHLAEFYIDPANVARIAEGKIRGGYGGDDGEFPLWRPTSERDRPAPDDRVARALARWTAGATTE
jgi:hypothetical protein